MSKRNFSIKKSFSFGWSIFKKSPFLLIGVVLFSQIVNIVGNLISSGAMKLDPRLGTIFAIAYFMVVAFVSVGLVIVALDFVKEQSSRFLRVLFGIDWLFSFIISWILYGLIVGAGIVLLVDPGIIWAVKFQFFPYSIVDKDKGPIEALKYSSEITKGSKWHIFLFDIMVGLLNFAGVLALGVGALVTVPITMVATANVYYQLQGTSPQNEEHAEAVE